MKKSIVKSLAIVMILLFVLSNLVHASSIISTKTDKNGYYTIKTTDKLNLTGITKITLPASFDKDAVTSKYFEKSGKAISATLTISKTLLSITPKSKLIANTTYTVKLVTKSKKKYIMNVVSKSESIKNPLPTPTHTPTITPTAILTPTPTPNPSPTPTPTPIPSPTPTPKISIDENGFYELTTDGYLNAVEESIITLPISFNSDDIEGTSISNNEDFIPANITIDKNKISIKPSEFFKDGYIYNIRLFTADKNYSIKLQAFNIKSHDYYNNRLYKIPANPDKGFNYPYYLYIPGGDTPPGNLLVETNNSDFLSDIMEYHEDKAIFAATYSMGAYSAAFLRKPILVPAFPKPLDQAAYRNYQSLTRDVMLINSGDGKRVDLQLIEMIKDAQKILKNIGINVEEKILMTGFSASGQFAQRFTILHPEIVKAIFAQGTSTLPIARWKGKTLRYPVGVADLQELTGKAFDAQAYNKVAKFLFMNDEDTNDGSYNRDMFEEQDGKLLREVLGEKIFPDRWNETQKVFENAGFSESTQFNTYHGTSHTYPQTMYPDMLNFIISNSGEKFTRIKAHENAIESTWQQDVNDIMNKLFPRHI